MTDYLAERLPSPSEWSAEERGIIAKEVAQLLMEGGEGWQSILDMITLLVEGSLPRWRTPEELQKVLLQVLEDESVPQEIRHSLAQHLQLVFWEILEQEGYRIPLSEIRSYLNLHLGELLETLEQFGAESEAQVNTILGFLRESFGLHLKGA
jgi:hypothetical protein